MQKETTIEILNDLIAINNDRVEGYEKAVKELEGKDPELNMLFNNNAAQSRGYSEKLRQHVKELGGDAETGTTNRGKVYRVWMDIRSSIASDKTISALNLCEFGEDAAQKAYEDALKDQKEVEPAVYRVIMDQKASLKDAHDHIKVLRDKREMVS